ncbi:MAG TPA: DUF1292 domain-containing protein, partial [bacterium]|nr:DUF1292 domain-containing protein [bacterium]
VTERGEAITLLDENGATHQFNLVDIVEVDGHRYAILQPENEEPAEVFRVEGETLVAVEDEVEFRRVAAAIEETEEYDDVEIVGNDAVGKHLDGSTKENGGRRVM